MGQWQTCLVITPLPCLQAACMGSSTCGSNVSAPSRRHSLSPECARFDRIERGSEDRLPCCCLELRETHKLRRVMRTTKSHLQPWTMLLLVRIALFHSPFDRRPHGAGGDTMYSHSLLRQRPPSNSLRQLSGCGVTSIDATASRRVIRD
jgi:hypothetical protein